MGNVIAIALRVIAGLGALILLIVNYAYTEHLISDAGKISAIQATQAYTMGAFNAICIIGIAVALYIFSKFLDHKHNDF